MRGLPRLIFPKSRLIFPTSKLISPEMPMSPFVQLMSGSALLRCTPVLGLGEEFVGSLSMVACPPHCIKYEYITGRLIIMLLPSYYLHCFQSLPVWSDCSFL